MTRVAALLSVMLVLLLPHAVVARQRIVIYCDDGYPPYSHAVEGVPQGIYIDILTKMFEVMDEYEAQIIPIPWRRGLAYLETGEGFALVPPYRRAEERPYMEYSAPILREKYSVMVRDEDGSRRHWPKDFGGTVIGKNRDFIVHFDRATQDVINAGGIRIDDSGNTMQNLMKLYLDRIQGYASDPLSAFSQWKQLRETGDVSGDLREICVLSEEYGYLGLTSRKPELYPYKERFVARFNEVLHGMQERGELERIVMRYFAR